MVYVDYDYYKNCYSGTLIEEDTANSMLKKASQKVDSLTFNRIVGCGFDNLTEFQKKIIKDAVCSIADYDYNSTINNGLNSYSINGVSMSFDKSNIVTICGVEIPKDTYTLLSQTGLTYKGGI